MAAAAAGGRAPASLPTLSGRWRKDEAASDSMEAACNMVQLPWLYRLAIKILRVMVVRMGASPFENTSAHACRDVLHAAGVGLNSALLPGPRLALQLEDSEGFFKSVMKAGGLMDVVEEVCACVRACVHADQWLHGGGLRGGWHVAVWKARCSACDPIMLPVPVSIPAASPCLHLAPLPQYPWSGEEVVHARRDKRRGSHRGRVTRTERGPCIS